MVSAGENRRSRADPQKKEGGRKEGFGHVPEHYGVLAPASISVTALYSRVSVYSGDSENGEVIEESRIPTSPKAFQRRFSGTAPMRI